MDEGHLPGWLEDLLGCFRELPEGELPPRREEIDY
jgi:hypothetical protein